MLLPSAKDEEFVFSDYDRTYVVTFTTLHTFYHTAILSPSNYNLVHFM